MESVNTLDENGNTPLIAAAINQDKNEVIRLLELGADPSIGGRLGMTAKSRAKNLGYNEIVAILEDAMKENETETSAIPAILQEEVPKDIPLVGAEDENKEQSNNSNTTNNDKKNLAIKDIFLFDSLFTPKIVPFVYWLMLLGSLVSGLGLMSSGYMIGFFSGLVTIIVGAISSRIFCELLIVLFKIHNNIQRIADESESRSS